MIKDFLRHSIIYTVGVFLTRGISFLLLPLYTRVLSPNDYGLISILSSVAALILPFLTLELTQAIGIYYSESKSEEERVSYYSTAFWFILVSNICYALIFYNCYQHLNYGFLSSITNKSIVLIVFLGTAINTVFNILQSQLLWRQKSVQYSSITIASVLLTIVLTIYLVLELRWGAMGVFLASLFGNLLGALLSFYATRDCIKAEFNLSKLKQLLSFSAPLIPSNLGFYAFLYIDQLLVNHYLGMGSAGIYAVACRFVIVVNLVLYAVGSALPPFIYQNHQKIQTKTSLEFITRLFVVFAFLIVLGLLLAGQDIILLFATPAYLGAAKLISILALATFIININIFTPGLIIAKRSGIISSLNVLAAILNLGLCFYLIPKYGIEGAALSSLISAIVYGVSYFLISQRLYRIDYQPIRFVGALATFVLLYYCFYQYNLSFSKLLWADLIEKLFLGAIITMLFLLLALKPSEWSRIFAFGQSKLPRKVLN
jgi:O-antigen/teichoic acid export membrane protein